MIQDRAIVWNVTRKPYLSKFLNCTIFSDLEWPLTHISRSLHYLTLNLRNGTRYRHSCNGILKGTYLYMFFSRDQGTRVSFRLTLTDLEWLIKIFNDTKHRAASLRHLSFLLINRTVRYTIGVLKTRVVLQAGSRKWLLCAERGRTRACAVIRFIHAATPMTNIWRRPATSAFFSCRALFNA